MLYAELHISKNLSHNFKQYGLSRFSGFQQVEIVLLKFLIQRNSQQKLGYRVYLYNNKRIIMTAFDYLLHHTCCYPYTNHVTAVAVKRFSHCIPVTYIDRVDEPSRTAAIVTHRLLKATEQYITIIRIISCAYTHEIIGVTYETILVMQIVSVRLIKNSKPRSGWISE